MARGGVREHIQRFFAGCFANLGLKLVALVIAVIIYVLVHRAPAEAPEETPDVRCPPAHPASRDRERRDPAWAR